MAKGLIPGIGALLGMEEFGTGVGRAAFNIAGGTRKLEESQTSGLGIQDPRIRNILRTGTPTQKQNLTKILGRPDIQARELEDIGTAGLQPREVVGSAIQTGLSVAGLRGGLPKIGTGIKAGAKAGAITGAAFGGAEGIKEGTGVVPGALLGGATGALTGALLGGVQRAIRGATRELPERLNRSVLRQGINDLRAEATGKKPVLSRQMLEKRIKGSPAVIVEKSGAKISDIERKIVDTLNRNEKTSINTTNIIRSLDDIVERKRNVFGNKGVDLINDFKKLLNARGDKISVLKANQLKRDIYKELSEASFNAETLSTSKEVLRRTASALRQAIGEAVPSIKRLNAEQQFHIRLVDALEDQLLKKGRINVVGLSDTILAGSGLGAGEPITGLAAAAGKRLIESPGVKTRAAIGLDQLGDLIERLPTDSAGKISKTALFNLIGKTAPNQNTEQ